MHKVSLVLRVYVLSQRVVYRLDLLRYAGTYRVHALSDQDKRRHPRL